MTNLAKIAPEYDMYEAYSISSNDSEGNLHEPILKPSQILSLHSESKLEYDSDSSDDYNHHNVIVNVNKNSSDIRNSLRNFRSRLHSMSSNVRNSLSRDKKKTNLKKIFACVTTFVTGVTLLFALGF